MLCLASSSSLPSLRPRTSPTADRPGPGNSGGGGAGGSVRLSVVSVPSSLRWSWPLKANSKISVPETARENKTVATEDGVSHLPIYDLDPKLAEFKNHFNYRMRRYHYQKHLIEKHEGSLEEFSRGYLKFGINAEPGATVYREWAPAAMEAQLVGDFNNWNGSEHMMTKDNFGVWSIKISHVDGKPAIPHNSKVKFRFRHDGVWVERIPAWIRYTIVNTSKFGAPYDGVHWDPPTSERYVFKHPRPRRPDIPRIYEAHVGMSGEKPEVYREFADNVLPRIRAKNYNTVQLMAIMEHSYYASFGYHVTNFFAVSSKSGTPEDLKYLVDKAHSLGLRVLMDVVHSHASKNVTDGLNGYDVGQSAQESYFYAGDRGYHKLWDSRLFNYTNWEVLRFLLSNLRYWMDEFMFDGFRFDGVTSMLYNHHGINTSFTGNYKEYFGLDTNVDAIIYMMLANHLIHKLLPEATIIAEDVSVMPVLCRPVDEGGVGFDYRQAMAIPERWVDYLKNKDAQELSMSGISQTLNNRDKDQDAIETTIAQQTTPRSTFDAVSEIPSHISPTSTFEHNSQLETSPSKLPIIQALEALLLAERQGAAALRDATDIMRRQIEQSDALLTKTKQEMDEVRKKQAKTDQILRLLISGAQGNPTS
ncbi:1,4-alpha-glucan-branching enzyme, chloroplastic/amyloplastic-like isoform X2 [Aegilops tauschii subsp. strangulata]|uniref:1,4-alpha-glucan-branching enzyme, chloroplastic/amyloplastic-like isoform X2 n=1 Tax=Aegilops tauschii subsp. strangulata TaxID=200361 RepID=UPI001ABC406D|nr:1,4-alpha-glucan-branching enzyme, chloroplastic/amyloplastic-like isoform X2 [Aegilops tauschii subsp. strangulata]